MKLRVCEAAQAGSGSKSLCAGLIVKNEALNLRRCLTSLKGVADGIYVVDTGSTDNTLQVLEDAARDFADVNWEVFTGASEKDSSGEYLLWDFSVARNRFVEAIEQRGHDFVLWMDADDELITPELRQLIFDESNDAHGVLIQADAAWTQHRLWRTGLGIRFEGRCHEYPDLSEVRVKNHESIVIRHHGSSSPAESSLARNLRILKREFEQAPNSRCAFYLGNTYRELSRPAEAIAAFEKRLSYGIGYADEYYFTLLYLGRCLEQLGQDGRAREMFLKGASERPGWSEFWMALALLEYRLSNLRHALGYAFLALERPLPKTLLWREPGAYDRQPNALIVAIYQKLALAKNTKAPQAP
jgi:glycosyltransferase involved in cell wall biosynthesis